MQTIVRVWGALLALVPLLFFSNVSDKGMLAQTALLSGLVGMGLLFVAVRKMPFHRVLHPVIALALLGLVGTALLGLWPAQVFSLALSRTGTILMLAALVFVLASAFRMDWLNWTMALRMWTAVMLFECVLGFAQLWGWTDFAVLGEQPPMGTLAFRNGLCEVLAVSTPLAFVLFRTDKSAYRWMGLVAGLLFSALIWSQEVTGAKLAWSLSIVVLAGFEVGIRLRKQGLSLGSLRMRMIGLALLFLAGVTTAGWMVQKRLGQMDEQVILQTQSSSEERMVMWAKSVDMLLEHPVLGVGTGQWPIHALEKGLVGNFQGFATRFYRRAHNDYLQLFAEQGLIGGLSLLILLLGACGLGWMRSEKEEENGTKRILMGAVAALVAWAAIAAVTFPLERPTMLIALGGLLALVGGLQKTPPGKALDRLLAGTLGLVLLGFAGFSTLQHLAERHVFNMLGAKSEQNWVVVEREANKAQNWYLELEFTTLSPLDWFLGTALLQNGQVEKGRDVLRKAKALHPWYPHTFTNLATAEAITGDPNAASALLEEALERFPEFDEARMNLVRLCLQFNHQDCIDQQVQHWEVRGVDPRINVFLREMGIERRNQP